MYYRIDNKAYFDFDFDFELVDKDFLLLPDLSRSGHQR